ncbi:MAG: hypothetical protein NZ958_06320 [Bacteroidia bacterium]|nr:hypothetical protein [Bacteroidia bacterium]MDW8088767.1 hypothetical protein [Bacteroidia bacterium]
MRYARSLVGLALVWAVVGCASGPSENFKNQVSAELADLKKAQDQVASLKADVGQIQSPLDSLKQALGKVWSDKVEKDKDLAPQLKEVGEEVQKLTNDLNSVEGQLGSAITEAESFANGLAQQTKGDQELKPEWDNLKNKVNQAAGQLAGLTERATQLKQRVSSLTEAIQKKYSAKK